jgi:hypothetical protein
VSDRPRKGEHRFHIAFANSVGIAHCTCVMAKGRRDRATEEDLVSRAIVLSLARASGIVGKVGFGAERAAPGATAEWPIRVDNRPSPEPARTTRLRRLQTFAPSQRNGKVRHDEFRPGQSRS